VRLPCLPARWLNGQRTFPVSTSNYGLSASAQAYSLNATVVPQGMLGYLTLWPDGEAQPVMARSIRPRPSCRREWLD